LCRSTRDSETWFHVFQKERRKVPAPFPDLLANSLMQQLRIERAAVEENGICAWTIPEKSREVPCDGAVGGIGKPPFPQGDLRPVRTRVRIAFRKKALKQDTFDLCACELSRTQTRDQVGPTAGKRDLEGLVRPACAGQSFFFNRLRKKSLPEPASI
jgi:hypothetical protein